MRNDTSPFNGYDDVDDDEHDDNDDDDHMVPLVAISSSNISKQVSPFEIALRRHHQQRNENSSYLEFLLTRNTLKWLAVGTGIVISIFLATFLFTKSNNGEDQGDGVVWVPTNPPTIMAGPRCDELQFGTTFEELVRQVRMAESSSLCNEKISDAYRKAECHCSTLEPAPMVNSEDRRNIGTRWERAFVLQKERVQNVSLPVDVALIGDSITEHWLGTDLGDVSKRFIDCKKVYEELFTRDGGGKVDGFVMGISEERSRQLLFRLRNGALVSDHFRPKVFWLLIGTNDIGEEYCDVDAIVAGNIAIIEELQTQRPDSVVVVNGILPRTNLFDEVGSKVNARLECYANMTEAVQYFDTAEIFRNLDGSKIDSYFEDGLHPNLDGYRVWGAAAVEVIEDIIGRP